MKIEKLQGRSIVLLGMMVSGKSAIGKLLAKKLALPFKDADTEIEKAAGRTVPEIFEQFGETEFRRLEARVIERVLEEEQLLLALGGGAFMSEETREIISGSAVSIWLKADLELLLSRVLRRPNKRPLLKNGNPREILANLLEVREPVYALADLHVDCKDTTKTEMRDIVHRALKNHLSDKQKSQALDN